MWTLKAAGGQLLADKPLDRFEPGAPFRSPVSALAGPMR
jgi:hypothetical protein